MKKKIIGSIQGLKKRQQSSDPTLLRILWWTPALHCTAKVTSIAMHCILCNTTLCVLLQFSAPCVTIHQCYEAWQPPSDYWEPSVLPPTSPSPPLLLLLVLPFLLLLLLLRPKNISLFLNALPSSQVFFLATLNIFTTIFAVKLNQQNQRLSFFLLHLKTHPYLWTWQFKLRVCGSA